jgi:hypothetical protein
MQILLIKFYSIKIESVLNEGINSTNKNMFALIFGFFVKVKV